MRAKRMYKPILACVLAAAFLFAGCSGRDGDKDIATGPDTDAGGVEFLPDGPEPLFRFTSVETSRFESNFETDFPVSVSVRWDTPAGVPVESRDADTIRAVFEAMRDMLVYDLGNVYDGDALVYTFTMADGASYSYAFAEGYYFQDGNKEAGVVRVAGFEQLTAALSPPAPEVDNHQPGNDANGGWALAGENGETYVGTEYGLFRVDKDGSFYQYTPYPALWLHRFGEYLIYAEYDNGYQEGMGIRAFDLTPLSEPYPTETLYEGTASHIQVDARGWIYFLGDDVLWRASLAPLADGTGDGGPITLEPEAIAWESPAATGGDAVPSPHGAPQAPALSLDGLYVKLDLDGARHQEMVYRYSLSGKEARKIESLSDISFGGMFWFEPAKKLIIQGALYENGVLENGLSGVYAVAPDSDEFVWLSDDTQSDFTIWYDEKNATDENPHPAYLVMAGSGAEGSRSGIYTIDVGGETAGEPVQLYDGPALSPNIANGSIYFRVPSEREGAMYDYYRVLADGSSEVERLDFETKTIATV